MPRRKNLPAPPEDAVALSRSTLEKEFTEAIDLYGDPRLKLLDIAAKAERDDDLATAARCLSEVAQYVAPKLRAMEVQANIQATHVVFNIDLGDDDLEEETVDAQP